MRVTQSQTQMLGMLVVGLVLYLMFNRYQSHQQSTSVAANVQQAINALPNTVQIGQQQLKILMGTADFKRIG